jgi:hypothetical protein
MLNIKGQEVKVGSEIALKLEQNLSLYALDVGDASRVLKSIYP